MNDLKFLLGQIWQGKSTTRAFLNLELSKETLRGKIIDIGGGKNLDYVSFMTSEDNCELRNFDIKAGETVDFEKDTLPLESNFYDTVLFLNVMEHIFNYQHIANEVVRVTKQGGQLIGFVPFLMWYHPDHSDYFRYTNEALQKIFEGTSASKVTIIPVHRGAFTAAGQMTLAWFPKALRIPIFVLLYGLDYFFVEYRSIYAHRYALGYLFKVEK